MYTLKFNARRGIVQSEGHMYYIMGLSPTCIALVFFWNSCLESMSLPSEKTSACVTKGAAHIVTQWKCQREHHGFGHSLQAGLMIQGGVRRELAAAHPRGILWFDVFWGYALRLCTVSRRFEIIKKRSAYNSWLQQQPWTKSKVHDREFLETNGSMWALQIHGLLSWRHIMLAPHSRNDGHALLWLCNLILWITQWNKRIGSISILLPIEIKLKYHWCSPSPKCIKW